MPERTPRVFSLNTGHTEAVLAQIPGFRALSRAEKSRQLVDEELPQFLGQQLPDKKNSYGQFISLGRDERDYIKGDINDAQLLELLKLTDNPLNQELHILNLQLSFIRSIHVELLTQPTMALYLNEPETLQDPELFWYFVPSSLRGMPMLMDAVEFFSSDECIAEISEIIDLIEQEGIPGISVDEKVANHPLTTIYDLYNQIFLFAETNSLKLADVFEHHLLSDQAQPQLLPGMTPELEVQIRAYVQRVREFNFAEPSLKIQSLFERLKKYTPPQVED